MQPYTGHQDLSVIEQGIWKRPGTIPNCDDIELKLWRYVVRLACLLLAETVERIIVSPNVNIGILLILGIKIDRPRLDLPLVNVVYGLMDHT